MHTLFNWGQFDLHAGLTSPLKIDCAAFSTDDWFSLALLALPSLPPFGRVEGVPRGGLLLAGILSASVTGGEKRLLIVDDVLTTGGSMEAQRGERAAIGLVVFARGRPAPWITALFTMTVPEPGLE